MKVADNFRFYIGFSYGEIEVFPFNNRLSFCWTKDRRIGVYRYELKTELLFKGQTFDKLYELMKDCGVCHDISIRIQIKCDNVWSDHFNGKLDIKKGSWSLSRCQVSIKPDIDDVYSCMLRNWKEKKNLFNIEDRINVGTSGTRIECTEKYYDKIDLFDIRDIQPVIISLYSTIYIHEFGFNSTVQYSIGNVTLVRNGQKYDVYYEVCQEISETEPVPTTGWTFVNDVWVRPVNNLGLNGGQTWYSGLTITYPTNPTGINLQFNNPFVNIAADNGLSLEDAFNYLLEDCNITICSDFFGFGTPSGNAPNNSQYGYALAYLQNIVLFQASDIILADADDNAFKFWKCLEELFNDFALKFKLVIFYDDVSNCMRIENETWQQQRFMLDLTQQQFRPYLEGNREWSFDQEKRYRRETFKEKENSELAKSEDFDQAYIKYNQNCINEDLDDKEYKTECMLTDLLFFYLNEDFKNDNEVLLSMFPIALDSNNEVITGFGAYSGTSILNAPLSWANIIEVFWIDNKHQLHGEMNKRPKEFNSLAFQRVQNVLSFPFCCADWKIFNPTHRVRTQLGWGIVQDDVCWNFPTCNIEDLELAFKC